MEIVFYVIIFIVGTLLGQICARIAQRISKRKKAFAMHSYCSNCGKKLTFFEQIPIISYIFLKGKCKNCKKKIEPVYIILEILTGILLLLVAFGLEFNLSNINIASVISFVFITLYISYIVLTIAIDKKRRNMPAVLLAYGITISLLYIVYLCITEKNSIYVNIIYLTIMVILLLVNILNTKKRAQSSYVLDLLTMLLIMLIFTRQIVCILTISATLISIGLYILIHKIKRAKGQRNKMIFSSIVRLAYIMGTLNLIIFLILINILK